MADYRLSFRRRFGASSLRNRTLRVIACSVILFAAQAGVPAQAGSIESGESAYARQDYTRSAAIFLRKAELGNAEAQTYLGYMYANGRGVPRDYIQAYMWLLSLIHISEPTRPY